jgi:hypothetical protein
MTWVTPVLVRCGATSTAVSNETIEPTNEEEFALLQFTSDTPITFEMYQIKKEEYQLERGLSQIRKRRDVLLQESDWITIPVNWDRLQNKTEWDTYRQDLRDIPQKVSFQDFVWDNLHRIDMTKITFPTKPKVQFS